MKNLPTKAERDKADESEGKRGPLRDDDGERWLADNALTEAILEGVRLKSPEPVRALLKERMKDPAFAARYRRQYPEKP